MKVVLKIGGSIFGDSVDVNLKTLTKGIKEWSKNHDISIVLGAGKLSRELDKVLRKYTEKEDLLDKVGIQVARLNASVLIAALDGLAHPEIPRSEEEFMKVKKEDEGKLVVAGGFRPGQRTDAVAVEIAKKWGAELVVKCTDVDYVYDKDPAKFPDAKPIEEISFEKLKKLGDQTHEANKPTIIDKVAAEMLAEEEIKMAIVNGKDAENIGKIFSGKEFKGTKVGF